MRELSDVVIDLLRKHRQVVDLNTVVLEIQQLQRKLFASEKVSQEDMTRLLALLKLKIGLAEIRYQDVSRHERDFDRVCRYLRAKDGLEEVERFMNQEKLSSLEENALEEMMKGVLQGDLPENEPDFFPRVPDVSHGPIPLAQPSTRIRHSRSSSVWGKKVTGEILSESPEAQQRAMLLRHTLRKLEEEKEESRMSDQGSLSDREMAVSEESSDH